MYAEVCSLEETTRHAIGSFFGLLLSQTYAGGSVARSTFERRIRPSRRIITALKTGV
jgi:hypothetical protein